MLIDWINEKRTEFEECLAILEPSKRIDMRLRTEYQVANYFNIDTELLNNIPVSYDEKLEKWLRNRNVEVSILYKILVAHDDVNRCYEVGIKYNHDEAKFKEKMKTLEKTKRKIAILEKKEITPLRTVQSPNMTIKLLEDFISNVYYLELNENDRDKLRSFVLRKYKDDAIKNGATTYQIRYDDPTKERIQQANINKEKTIKYMMRKNKIYPHPFYDRLQKLYKQNNS